MVARAAARPPRTDTDRWHNAADALIGGALVAGVTGQPERWDAALAEIRPDLDLPTPRHRAAFAAIEALRGRGDTIDLFAVEHEAAKAGAAAVDLPWLSDCQAMSPGPSFWRAELNVCREIQQRSDAQIAVSALLEDVRRAPDARGYAGDLCRLGEKLLAVATGSRRGLREQLREVLDRLGAAGTTAIRLHGWDRLRDLIGDLEPGEATLIGAKFSGGKSTLLKCLALDLARGGTRVGIVSLEDAEPTWIVRMLADASGVAVDRLRKRELDWRAHEKIASSAADIAKLPIDLVHVGAADAATVVGAVGRVVASGAKVVIVDYVQQIRDRNPDRAGALGAAFARLKTAAVFLRVHVIVATQWPNLYLRSDKPPALGAAKGSGDIEAAAENVVWIWTPGDPSKAEEKPTHLHVVKAKNGRTGRIPVTFDREHSRIYEGPPRLVPPDIAPDGKSSAGGSGGW